MTFKIGDRVITPHGPGVVRDIEINGTDGVLHSVEIHPVVRLGVYHNEFPESRESIRHLLMQDVLYINKNKVTLETK